MMSLANKQQQIFIVLTPYIQTVEERRALLTSAFGVNHPLLNQVTLEGSSDQFFWNLLPTIDRFGEIKPNVSATQGLLEAIRDLVGVNHKDEIDLLIQELRRTAKPQPNCIFVGFAPDDAKLGSYIAGELANLDKDIEVQQKEEMKWEGDEPIYCAVILISPPSKALALREAKDLVKKGKRIVTVLVPGTDPSIIPVTLNGTPVILLNNSLSNLSEIKIAVEDAIDTVRGLQRERWEILVSRIQSSDCVPIVGPDMCREPIKSESEIALDWSNKFGYALGGEVEISRVAQYLAYMESEGFNVKRELSIERSFDTLPGFLGDENNHYRILARLPFKLIINTAADSFLNEALIASGKKPEEWHFWNEEWLEEHRDELETKFYELTDETPAIVYLFGHHSNPESMRLSEDEFLEYLFRSGQNFGRSPSLFPTWLPNILSNKMLLILGFQLHDWRFRTITHAFADYFKSGNDGLSHLAVQIPPLRKQPSQDDEKKVKAYIEKYLGKLNSHVVIGTPENFLSQLKQKWETHSS